MPQTAPEAPPMEPQTEPAPAPAREPDKRTAPDPFNPEWPKGRPEPEPKA